MLEEIKEFMQTKLKILPSSIYIYTLRIEKFQSFCQMKNIEIINKKSAEAFFDEHILKQRFYGTQASFIAAIKTLFLANNIVLEFPAIKNKKHGIQLLKIMNSEELNAMINYFSKPDLELEPYVFERNRLMFDLIFQAAPSLSEIRLLNIDDINLNKHYVQYNNRQVPLSIDTANNIRQYLYWRSPQIYTSPALFLNEKRIGRLTNRGIEFIFNKMMAKAGIRDFTPKDVMNTCIHILLKPHFINNEEAGVISFFLTLTGKRCTKRIDNIINIIQADEEQKLPLY